MALLLYYINCRETVLKQINHIFPVRGHSYMPPDHVFGRIEKCLRKKEIITSPSQYHNIFKKFAQVHVVNKDYFFYDFKKAVKNIIKPNSLKTTEQKVFSYTKGINKVGVSQTYKGTPVQTAVLKRNANISSLTNIDKLPMINHVKLPKQKDIKNLMRFFDVPEDAIDFYNDIFKPNELPIEETDNVTNEDGVPLYDQNADY